MQLKISDTLTSQVNFDFVCGEECKSRSSGENNESTNDAWTIGSCITKRVAPSTLQSNIKIYLGASPFSLVNECFSESDIMTMLANTITHEYTHSIIRNILGEKHTYSGEEHIVETLGKS